ncbi:MAG: bifunctional adenosylcobinamide kinase/adenosylcobinamide-phosphate guanylyltransferase [Lachnospiraceae bacterium]
MMVTIIGESGSGKSEYAENLIMDLQRSNNDSKKLYYIATMEPYGKEAKKRISRHRKERSGKGFITVEYYNNTIDCCLEVKSNILLECMSNLAANIMFNNGINDKYLVYNKICNIIGKFKETASNLVVVTNDIFADGNIYDRSTMEYIELLGMVNRYLTDISDKAEEVIYSCPFVIKGGT